jgi:tetratricopeptide (TPR) repeat protein
MEETMRISTRYLTVGLLMAALLLIVHGASAQQAGRIAGTVVGPDGKPIEGVTITISAPALSREMVKRTNAKGKFTVSHSDAAMTYEYRFEKEGYQTLILQVSPPVGGTDARQYTLQPVATAASGGGSSAAKAGGRNSAIRTFNEGVEAQRLDNLDLATAKFREAAELDPEMAVAHTALAAVAVLAEDYPTAAAEAEAALAIDPEDVRAMQIRFDAYRLGGDDAKAKEAARALREVGDLSEAAGRIYNEGVDAYQSGDTATAQVKFRQVIELDPEMVSGYIALAQVTLIGGDPAESAAMLASALDREPDNVQALKLSFDAGRLSGNTEMAAHALERLVELDPKWMTTVLFEHAAELFNADEAANAAFLLAYVVKADPQLARAHFMLGMALFNSGHQAEGREHLETFIELAPEDPDAEIARSLLSFGE